MNKENNIIELAIENLKKQIGNIEILPTIQGNKDYDAYIRIANIDLKCIFKQEINSSNIISILDICHRRHIDLLVARHISRLNMERMLDEGINTLEVNGNCIIDIPGKLHIRIFGIKDNLYKPTHSMTFRFAGIKVLFSLLSMSEQQIPTIRDLSKFSGASIGTVKHVIDVLQSNDFVFISSKGKFLKDRERLLDEWVRMYNFQLRAEQQVGRASWIGPSKNWQNINLPDGMIWGSDCGAYILTGYMTPADFCIYTELPVKEIVKTKALVPNKDGEVFFYQKFWEGNLSELGHAIICYADLINQNNSRCLEVAKKLRNEKITYSK